MFGKIFELVLSAKSSAVSGVLILAGGAVVSASSGAGVAFTLENDEPTPIVEVADPPPSPLDDLLGDDPSGDPSEDEGDEEVLVPTDADCDDEGTARGQARERIQAAFTKYDTKLDELRARLEGKGSARTYEAISNAEALLVEIRDQALGALDDMGLCETEDLAAAQGAIAFAFRGGAAAMLEIADRALAAMETVFNLARSAVLAEIERLKPTPTPKPKATPKPSPKSSPKAPKAPSCDDAVYEAKKRMAKAFEQYHDSNHRLLKELKGWAPDRVIDAVRGADEVLHATYDRSKERILRAGCATGAESPMHHAEEAAAVFERTYAGSRELFQAVAGDRPDREACTSAMYAAKEVMYEAFERWHGANDKLISGLKSFASEATIQVAKDADEVLHKTFDRTKELIVSAQCAKEQPAKVMELAQGAAKIFETVHLNARVAVAAELARR